MKNCFKRFGIVVAVVTIGITAAGCRGAPAVVEPRPDIHGNIHRVEYGANVAYIFGAMHLGRPNWFPLSAVVEDAMRRADVFAFEFDLTQVDMIGMFAAQYMMLPDGQTLRDFLPQDVYEIFIANLSTFDFFQYELMNTLTPFLLAQSANVEAIMDLGLQAEYSVDFYVLDFALERGLPIVGLNTLQSEAALLFDLPAQVQIAAAATMLDKAATLEATDDLQMIEMYETQDLASFLELRLALAEPDDAASVHFLRYGLHGRCHIFAAEIGRLLTQTAEPTTFFITVGLLHIIGGDVDTNVLSLLSSAGFEVVPIF